VELTIEDEEEFVGVVVCMPEMFTLGMGDADVVIVDRGDDSGAVNVAERLERLGQIDGLGSHDWIVSLVDMVSRDRVRGSV